MANFQIQSWHKWQISKFNHDKNGKYSGQNGKCPNILAPKKNQISRYNLLHNYKFVDQSLRKTFYFCTCWQFNHDYLDQIKSPKQTIMINTVSSKISKFIYLKLFSLKKTNLSCWVEYRLFLWKMTISLFSNKNGKFSKAQFLDLMVREGGFSRGWTQVSDFWAPKLCCRYR